MLKKWSLDDRAIRKALGPLVLRRHAARRSTVLLEEVGLNQGRVLADLMVVNGSLEAFEIKSDRDSLRRLRRQVEVYGQVVDRAILVVGARYASRARAILPKWWGLWSAAASPDGVRLQTVREARQNPGRRVEAIAQLLWREDAIELLRRKGARGGLIRGPRYLMWERICELYSLEQVANEVRSRLKARARAGLLRQWS
jgi:hypothetical protein